LLLDKIPPKEFLPKKSSNKIAPKNPQKNSKNKSKKFLRF
jgi:hypothetical protein